MTEQRSNSLVTNDSATGTSVVTIGPSDACFTTP
jgi:hypothetical protein